MGLPEVVPGRHVLPGSANLRAS